MIKGVSRRVVVVESPDRHLFEQAIFVLRNDANDSGVTGKALVEEARRVARRCGERDRSRRIQPGAPAAALLGAGAVALLWFLSCFLPALPLP